MPDINLVNYKNSCSVVGSEKYKKKKKIFFDDLLKCFPSCKDITEFIEFFLSTLMKTHLKGCNVLCQINEKCESCPCSLALMTKSSGVYCFITM